MTFYGFGYANSPVLCNRVRDACMNTPPETVSFEYFKPKKGKCDVCGINRTISCSIIINGKEVYSAGVKCGQVLKRVFKFFRHLKNTVPNRDNFKHLKYYLDKVTTSHVKKSRNAKMKRKERNLKKVKN